MPKLGTLNDPAFLILKKSTLFLKTECVNFRINCYFTFIERNILFTLICHPSFSHKAWCQSLLLPCNHYQVLLYFDQLKKKKCPKFKFYISCHLQYTKPTRESDNKIKTNKIITQHFIYFNKFLYFSCKKENQTGKNKI